MKLLKYSPIEFICAPCSIQVRNRVPHEIAMDHYSIQEHPIDAGNIGGEEIGIDEAK